MKRNLFLISILVFLLLGCSTPEQPVTKAEKEKSDTVEKEKSDAPKGSSGMSTPTETMKTFMQALKDKDVKKIRAALSQSSLKQYEKIAESQDKTLEEFIMSDEDHSKKQIPESRNEKITGDTATLEVKDDETGKWETLPFVKEDGAWKIAFDKMD